MLPMTLQCAALRGEIEMHVAAVDFIARMSGDFLAHIGGNVRAGEVGNHRVAEGVKIGKAFARFQKYLHAERVA